MKLYYVPGSPFARVIRVLLRELDIACEEVQLAEFPPPEEYFSVNPLGQVPALETEGGVRFPTRLIIDHVLACPRVEGSAVARAICRSDAHWQDEQILAVILAMGDALVSLKYQQWAGLRIEEVNLVGYDPAERNAERVSRTLDWLDKQATTEGLLPGVLSVQDITLACLLLWADARGGFPWRGRPRLEAIVGRCSGRPSFSATVPQPWP